MTRTRQLLSMIAVCLLMLGYSTSAGATLKICNKTSKPASVAVGVIYSAGSLTHGWYNLQPGECATHESFDGTLEAQGQSTYYYYAHSSAGAWEGDTQMCVDMTNLSFDFFAPPNDPRGVCAGSNGSAKGFRRMNLKTKDAELDLGELF